jgi:hypothetical protein
MGLVKRLMPLVVLIAASTASSVAAAQTVTVGTLTTVGASVVAGGAGLVTRFSYSPVTSIPEPATLSLLVTGIAGLAGWRRRTARKANV